MDVVQPNVPLMTQLVDQLLDGGQSAKYISSKALSSPLLKKDVTRTIPQRTVHPIGLAPIWFILLAPLMALAVWIRRQNGGR